MRRRRGLDNSEVYWGMCFGARKPTQSRVIVSGCRENWQSTQEDLTTGNVFPRMGHPEMMDRNGFWKDTRSRGLLMVTLRGKFKGEDNLRWHLVPIVDVTSSGIQVRKWVRRLLFIRCHVDGVEEGPLFVNEAGKQARLSDYNSGFQMFITQARERHPKVFSSKVEVEDYNLRRSLRRGSTTQAHNNGVLASTIELNNRWRKKEAAKGAELGLAMRQVYRSL
jgi:hypothetical protein